MAFLNVYLLFSVKMMSDILMEYPPKRFLLPFKYSTKVRFLVESGCQKEE